MAPDLKSSPDGIMYTQTLKRILGVKFLLFNALWLSFRAEGFETGAVANLRE